MKNITRTVRLEGELGEKFGEIWQLNVQSPQEAIKAIECQTKNFRKYILDQAEKGIGYEVLVGDQGIENLDQMHYPSPLRDDYTIIPAIQGGKSKGFGMILLGAAMFLTAGAAAGMFAPNIVTVPGLSTTVGSGMTSMTITGAGFSYTSGIQGFAALTQGSYALQATALMGGALMAGGAAMMLAPTMDSSAGNEEQSYLFDGAINSAKQGTPVPILYGRMIIGGATVSASIKSNQYTSTPNPRGRTYVRGIGSGTWGGYPAYQGHQTSGKKAKR